MPTRSTPGYDYARNYQQSTFRSLWKGRLPTGINKMITRALRSFGPDSYVLSAVWNEQVTTADGKTQTEAQYFGNTSYSNDICCADTVAWVVYQSGVADLVKNPKQIHPDGNIHYVDDFFPDKSWNKGVLRLIATYDDAHPEGKDEDFLPGDYLIYVDSAANFAEGNGHHINCYIGPFVETDGGQDVGDVFNLINGSLTLGGANAYVIPETWQGTLKRRKGGKIIVHGRFVAIERLFADAIGLPVNLELWKDPGPAPSDTDRLWEITTNAGAPYPVGVNFGWHQGVHVAAGGGVDPKNEVWAVAPGEIVAARLGAKEPTPEGDASFVLVRQRLLRARRTLIGPKEADPDKKSAPFFALYMHVAPAASYVDPKAAKIAGVPALGDLAPPWLRKIWPQSLPPRGAYVRSGTPLTLLATAKQADGSLALAVLGSDKSLFVATNLAVNGVTVDGKVTVPPLEKITIGGTPYYVVPQPTADATNASLWDADQPPSIAPPAKSVLAYFNPLDGSILKTSHRTPPGARLAIDKIAGSYRVDLRTAGADTYARIDTYTRPGFRVQKAQLGTFTDDATGKEMVHFDGKAKAADMFLDTTGEGMERDFIGDTASVSTAALIEAEGLPASTGKRKQYEKLWVKLVPVVAYTAAQRDAAEKTLNDASAKARREAKERLGKRQSRIVGAVVIEAEGWINDETGHAISPAPGAQPRFYTKISRDRGNKAIRTFKQPDDQSKRRDFDDTVIGFGDASGTAIFPLEIFKDRKKKAMALVEVVYAVPVSTAGDYDKKWIDDAEKDNKDRAAIAQALLDGEVVDLRKKLAGKKPIRGDLLSQESGFIAGEVLGHLGTIPRAPGAAEAQKGIHFEIFAGKSLILGEGMDASSPPEGGKYPDQAITPIPKSGFLVFEDLASKDLLKPEFLRRFVEKIAKLDKPALDFKELPGVFKDVNAPQKELDPRWVPKQAEWLAFCKTNRRQLSRIVSVHPSEWALDWPESLASDGSSQAQQSAAKKDELTRAHRTLAWLPSLELAAEDGVENKNALFFYHPVRFIELIKTGVDVAVRLRDETKKKDLKITLILEPDGREIPLERSPKDDLFSYRLHVGEAKSEAVGRLKLEGVATKNPEIPVRIVRGEIHRIQLLEPDVTISVDHEQPWMNYAIAIKQQVVDNSVSGVHLLPDGRAHLARSGYARASFRVSAYYNQQMPDKFTIQLAGAGFKISSWSLQGAVAATVDPKIAPEGKPPRFVPPATASVQKVEIALAPMNKPDLYSENPRTIAIVVEVIITPQTAGGSTGVLTASLDGGDLLAPWQGTAVVVTRPSITRDNVGQDVAQLQVYLSQIFATDEGPCFRLTETGSDDCLCDPHNRPGIVINGRYDDALRRALWRFIYSYAARKDWNATIISSKGVTLPAEIRAFAQRHQDWIGMPNVDQTTVGTDEDVKKFVERVEFTNEKIAKKAPAGPAADALDWPTVDGALLREIVTRFTTGNILPSIDFTVVPQGFPTKLTAGAPPIDTSKVADLKGSRILTWDGYRLLFRMDWKENERASAGDDPVLLVLKATSSYLLLENIAAPASKATGEIRTTVDQLIGGKVFALVWNPAGPEKKPDNVFRAIATAKADSQIGSASLSGPRDFFSDYQDKDRDAALVQFCLTQIPQKKKAEIGFVPNRKKPTVIDGKWSPTWAAVLDAFAADYGLPKHKSVPLVQALMAAYFAPAPAAPASPPPASPPAPPAAKP